MASNDNGFIEDISVTALLESVLFVASGPVSLGRLSRTLETTPTVVRQLLESLEDEYQNDLP